MTVDFPVLTLGLSGSPNPKILRPGDRKFVPTNHPPDGLSPLFAHLSGALRAVSLWGLLAPTPRRKLLKKLEQNFYVLLTLHTP